MDWTSPLLWFVIAFLLIQLKRLKNYQDRLDDLRRQRRIAREQRQGGN